MIQHFTIPAVVQLSAGRISSKVLDLLGKRNIWTDWDGGAVQWLGLLNVTISCSVLLLIVIDLLVTVLLLLQVRRMSLACRGVCPLFLFRIGVS